MSRRTSRSPEAATIATKPRRLPRLDPRKVPRPTLRFSPYAWAKLQHFCHAGETEIGGFGLAAADDLLSIVDFLTLKQTCSAVTVAFDDAAVADLFDAQVDAGVPPQRFLRVWLHTHPGDSPHPSATDEETFARVFGGCDWAVMFILARGGATYARLRFNAGPGGELEIEAAVDYTLPFAASDAKGWGETYDAQVHVEAWPPARSAGAPTLDEAAEETSASDLDEAEDAEAFATFGHAAEHGFWPDHPEALDDAEAAWLGAVLESDAFYH